MSSTSRGGASAQGGADGARGAGRASDISGELTGYAVGGLGGRSDSMSAASAGEGPGSGGDGGNGGPGGAGADGVVYVRLTDLYSTVKVPIPTTEDLLTLRHQWESGKTCTVFDYRGKTFRSSTDGRPYQWEDVLESVEGDNVVTCGPVGAGIGYYSIVVTLKDGFIWEDGTDESRRFRWTIVSDLDTVTAELDARKSVSWQDAENAVILIESTSSPEKSGTGDVKTYDLTFEDAVVSSAAGLDLQVVTLKVSTQSASAGWTDVLRWTRASGTVATLAGSWLATLTVDPAANTVSARIPGIGVALWTRLEITVMDNGIFRTNIGATLNEKTGLYEKNPNDGSAQVMMTDESGTVRKVTCEAETDIPWRYVAYPIEVSVTAGEIFINGTKYNPYALYEGANVPVYYRGLGGYKIKSVTVDGLPVAITFVTGNRYDFVSLDASHEIEVEYVRFYGRVATAPLNVTYDGQAHFFPVTLTDWDPGYDTLVKYALTTDATDDEYYTEAEFAERYPEMRNIGTHVFAYRVYAWQQGYGDTLGDSGWAWVNTGRQGTGSVTVSPAPLYVQPDYKKITTSDRVPTSFTYTIQGFVSGEGKGNISVAGWGARTIYQDGAGEGLYPVYMTGVVDRSINGNYIIHLVEGGLAVNKDTVALNDVRQLSGLGPDDGDFYTGVDPVVKVYDGAGSSLTLNVTWPTNPGLYSILYSTDDRQTWSGVNPVLTSVGKHKVWYKFEPTSSGANQIFTSENYQYVTILKRPITLTSASATKSYDGTPLTAQTVTVGGGGLAAADAIACTFGDGQTAVGSKDNAFAYEITGVGSVDDYDITVETGTLTVMAGRMTIGGVEQPDNPSRPLDQGQTGVDDVIKNYDGLGTNLVVKVETPAGATVRYSLDKTDWVESLSLVEVGEYIVHYKVEASNYATVQNFGRVIVKPAVATALSIVDHCDAGNGRVHLAVRPAVAGGITKEYVLALAANSGLAAVFGTDEASLATAEPVPVILRDPTAELDLAEGLVWVTVDVTGRPRPLYCKIIIR